MKQCWSSLFTDRAISYRAKTVSTTALSFLRLSFKRWFSRGFRNYVHGGSDHGAPQTVSIDASFGLGEALVSGVVSADLYQIRSGEIVKNNSLRKNRPFTPYQREEPSRNPLSGKQQTQALPDPRIIELAELGRKSRLTMARNRISSGLCRRQVYILQSRPITSLYPVVRFLMIGRTY
ncbi:PEP/pyruvate-binding domain-containing protein [Bacillus licheniformis]|nr:PEP/pyruvate-binding domain-containing protein [Bacillus licheniformis]